MKNWIWIITVVVLSAVSLSLIEKLENRNGILNAEGGRTATVILVESDGNAEGCGDAYVEYDIPVVSGRLKSVFAALQNFDAPEGLANPVKKHGLSFMLYEDEDDMVILDLVGEPKLGGICDVGRLKNQIERTLGLYAGDFEIRLNGSVDEYECMRLVTGGCAEK